MGEDFPARLFALGRDPFRIDGNDDALRAKALCRRAHKIGIRYRRCINAYLVCAGIEHGADIFERAYTPAHGQRNEDLAGNSFYGVYRGLAALVACCYVEEGYLVCAGVTVAFGHLNGVACVAYVEKLHALHDTPVLAV